MSFKTKEGRLVGDGSRRLVFRALHTGVDTEDETTVTKEFAIDMSHRLEKLASAVLKEIKTKEKKYAMGKVVQDTQGITIWFQDPSNS